jgi:uncharacterized protein YbjT (DUF2867 family)
MRVDGVEFFKDGAQIAGTSQGGSRHGAGTANGVDAHCEDLAQIRTQLVGFQGETAKVLFQDILAGDAAHPNRCGDREGERQGDDQPHGSGAQAASGIHAGKRNSQPIGKVWTGHQVTLTGD